MLVGVGKTIGFGGNAAAGAVTGGAIGAVGGPPGVAVGAGLGVSRFGIVGRWGHACWDTLRGKVLKKLQIEKYKTAWRAWRSGHKTMYAIDRCVT